VHAHCRHSGILTLRNWREESYRWDGTAYRKLPTKELVAELSRAAKAEMDKVNLKDQVLALVNGKPLPTVHKVTGRLVSDVCHALTSMIILSGRIETPTWLDGDGPLPAQEMLACRNGIVHLPSLVEGKPHFIPSTPRFFSPNALEFDFDENAPAPSVWLDFLNRLWSGDDKSIATLQEWMGYLLTPDTRQQKILMLVGPKRSGKGTIARVVRGVIGEENLAGPTLSSLGTNFGLWPLLGKTVAMIQDARLGGRSDMAAIIERLLSISGEDGLTIDRKNLIPVFAKLVARFMILTNELPKLGDSSGALAGRMILLSLAESWYGREDIKLTDRLLGERSGILLWAIEGWRRLQDRGHFIQPESGNELVEELANLSSPVGAFVKTRCRVAPECRIEKLTLFNNWKQWCDEQGREHAGDSATFGRNLRAVIPHLRESYPRTEGGRTYFYEGVALA
jgi:putative DNA primase/helicase